MSRIHAFAAVACFVTITFFSIASCRDDHIVTKDDCNITKTCVTLPDGCTNVTCYFISWRESEIKDTIEIELRGPADLGPGYRLAMAFGLRDAMQEADVYICDEHGLETATIRERYDFVPDPVSKERHTYPENFAYINGKTQCRFNRSMSVTKQINETSSHDFDLRTDSYYLLMAGGSFDIENGESHEWKIVYRKKINFTENFTSERENLALISTTSKPESTTSFAGKLLFSTWLLVGTVLLGAFTVE